MSFHDIKGNEKVVERMSRAIISRNISHAYLLEGDRAIDKLSLAETFAKAILCEKGEGDSCECCPSCRKISHGNHEDLIYLKAEGNSIKDESVEALQSKIRKKPYAGDRNVVILQDADTMTLRAQNRLLKTLEEPAPGAVLILLSENMENLTRTILSRCVIYKLNPFKIPEYKTAMEGAISIAEMFLKRRAFYEVSKKISEFTADRETAHEFLDALENWYRDLAVSRYDVGKHLVFQSDRIEEIRKRSVFYTGDALEKAVAIVEEARNDLNRNLNINYTMKNMILKMIA